MSRARPADGLRAEADTARRCRRGRARADPERKSLRGRLRREPKEPQELTAPQRRRTENPAPAPGLGLGSTQLSLGGLVLIASWPSWSSSWSSCSAPTTRRRRPARSPRRRDRAAATPPGRREHAAARPRPRRRPPRRGKVVAQINLTPTSRRQQGRRDRRGPRRARPTGSRSSPRTSPRTRPSPPTRMPSGSTTRPTTPTSSASSTPGWTNRQLSTAGGLPTNAAHYKQLIVTVETLANPKAPGIDHPPGPAHRALVAAAAARSAADSLEAVQGLRQAARGPAKQEPPVRE